MDSSIEEIEFIASSGARVSVLDALAETSRDRGDLQVLTGASPSTISRVIGDFEDRRWIERDGPMYELSPLGEFVAEQFSELLDAMETESKLRDVWRWLPREMSDFAVDHFVDAVVAYPGPGYPYKPLNRVIQLVERSTIMRGFGATIFKSAAHEAVCRAALGGMRMEYIFDPAVLAATVNWNPELFKKIATRDHCTILVHDDLPDRVRCGIDIFDDRIGICCHDETRALRAWIDTDAPPARSWAQSVFDRFRREARQVDEAALSTPIPDQYTSP